MKNIFKLMLVAFTLGFVSCGDEDSLSIDTLNTDGNEFFCNQKVKVWMCVNSSDLWHTDYKWTCDGGEFTQPQGLNEETWKAPNTPGTYHISCTATVGGKSETRTHIMYVSSYFFEKFEKSLYNFSLQGSNKNALKKESDGNQYLQLQVNSSSEYQRYLRRSFGDAELKVPFSTRMKLGFEKNIPNTQNIKVGTKSGNAMMEYRWNMSSNIENNGAYINVVRLRWYPYTPTDGYPMVTPDNPGEQKTIEGTDDYNVQLIVEYTNPNGKKTTYNEYHKVNTFNNFKNKLYQTVSMAIDENYNLTAYVAGQEALKSNIVADVRNTNSAVGSMYINYWEIYYLNGNEAKNIPVMYFDDAYASNTEILK